MGVKQLVFTFAVVIGLVPPFLFDRIILCVLDRLILLALGGPVIDFGFHTTLLTCFQRPEWNEAIVPPLWGFFTLPACGGRGLRCSRSLLGDRRRLFHVVLGTVCLFSALILLPFAVGGSVELLFCLLKLTHCSQVADVSSHSHRAAGSGLRWI
jgi:hypothetical protein